MQVMEMNEKIILAINESFNMVGTVKYCMQGKGPGVSLKISEREGVL